MQSTFIFLFLIIWTSNVLAQSKGEAVKDTAVKTEYIFESPRPLVSKSSISGTSNSIVGLDLLFSNNGFGFGAFYQYKQSDDLVLFANVGLSGARNTSELENNYDQETGRWFVSNKINRLYLVPINIGAQYFVFQKSLGDGFKPYIQAAAGPTLIFSTPYDSEFFNSLSHGMNYTRFGTFAGIGANINSVGKSLMAVNLRYYFIPFGGNGLESIRNLPIRDFGGVFISLSVGFGK